MCSRWVGTRRRAEVRRTRALAPARRDAIASFGSSNGGESSQPCDVSRDRAQVSWDILPDFWSAGGRAGSAGCPERDLTSATAWPSSSPSRPRRVDQSMDRSGVSGSGRLPEFGTRVAQGLEVERRTLAQLIRDLNLLVRRYPRRFVVAAWGPRGSEGVLKKGHALTVSRLGRHTASTGGWIAACLLAIRWHAFSLD
jgi:hypothetical protein